MLGEVDELRVALGQAAACRRIRRRCGPSRRCPRRGRACRRRRRSSAIAGPAGSSRASPPASRRPRRRCAPARAARSGWSAPCRSGSPPPPAPPPCRRASRSCRARDAMAARGGDAGGGEAAEPARRPRRQVCQPLIASSQLPTARLSGAAAPNAWRPGLPPVGEHEIAGDARALVDHRQARARMRAAADDIDAVDILETVVRPEIQHLVEPVGEVERRAAIDRELVAPVLRRQQRS